MGWTEAVPLGAHAQVIAGQSPDGRFYNQDGNGLPFYQGKKDFGASELQPPTKWTTQVTKEALPGDILMSVRAPVGPVNFTREKVCIGRGLAAIRCRNSMDADFLFYQLLGMQDRIAGKEGAVFASINKAEIEALPIVAPPLPEQRRIVAILDEAFEAIATAKANTEKNLQNTRDAFLAYRTAVLSTGGDEWDERQLGAVCVLQRGLDLPSRDRKPGPYPLLSSSGLIDTHVEGPVRGPGVVTGRSGSIGSVFYVEQDFWPLNTVLYVRDFCGNHPRFVYHLLEHFDLKRFASGAGVPTLNRNIVHEEIVLVPQSLSAQEKVADSLDKLYAACQKVEKVHVKKVSALDELKKSLLHQAFTGQLTAKSTDQQLEAVA